MIPEALGVLHARAFTRLRPWTAAEFGDLLQSPHVFLCSRPHTFALGRAVADEAELLTLATDPDHRRMGYGAACLRAFETEALNRGARKLFLEVDSENRVALALYEKAGFEISGQRSGYYALAPGRSADALTLVKRVLV